MSKVTIIDLYREEEISSADMDKVAGGMSCEKGLALASGYLAIASVLGAVGDAGGEGIYVGKAEGVMTGACG